MGYWNFKIMDGDDPCNRFDKIADIMNIEDDMRDEIVASFNTNEVFKESTKKYLIENFVVDDVMNSLFDIYKEQKGFYGINWINEYYKSSFFVYALAIKSIPNFKNNFLLCCFNVNFLEILEDSATFYQQKDRISSVIDFYNNICNTKIKSPKDVNGWEQNDVLLYAFIEKIKDEIFIKNKMNKEDLGEFKDSLLKINIDSRLRYPFRKEIIIEIEKRYLESYFINSLINKKHSSKI